MSVILSDSTTLWTFSTIEFSFIWNIKTKQRSGNMADVAWVRGSEGAAGFTFIQSTCVGQQLQHSTYLPGPTFSTIEKWRLHQNLKKAEEAGCNVRKRKCSNSFVPVGQFWSELFWKRSGSGLHRTRWKTLLGRFCAKHVPFLLWFSVSDLIVFSINGQEWQQGQCWGSL